MPKRASVELFPGQRQKEKRQLWGRYVWSAIERLYKERFFGLFGHRCFKCGADDTACEGALPLLCVDHHIPMALGGHLVPGNLVALCRRCNGLKLDQHPHDFYTDAELERLAPLLAMQEEFFAFRFDWDAWDKDRSAYLIALGLPAAFVHELLHDEMHRDFIGLPDPRGNACAFSISLGLAGGPELNEG